MQRLGPGKKRAGSSNVNFSFILSGSFGSVTGSDQNAGHGRHYGLEEIGTMGNLGAAHIGVV